MSDWKKTLEDDLEIALATEKKIVENIKKNPLVFWIEAGVIAAMAIGIGVLFYIDDKPITPTTQPTQPAITVTTTTSVVAPDKIKEIGGKISLLSEKISLLAIVANNNTVVMRDKRPASDLIILSEDWKINHLPILDMSQEDKEYISKYLNK